MQETFFGCVLLILYHYILYPIVICTWASAKGKHPVLTSSCIAPPSVSLIVPAYNEEHLIERKIENLRELYYDNGKLSIVLVLDGCTDRTAERAEQAFSTIPNNKHFSLLVHQENRGKVAVLNEAISQARSEIVGLTDTSALLPRDALRRSVVHFEDQEVGVVCPSYALSTRGPAGEGEYWSYQVSVKEAEAAVASAMGAHGAFYLFRRNLWSPMPPDTINDDFVLPMTIVAKGYRAVYDSNVVVTELEPSSDIKDFKRRMRIGAGNLQQVFRLGCLAHPARGPLAFVFISGKGIRAFAPLLAVVAFVAAGFAGALGSTIFLVLFQVGLLVSVISCVTPMSRRYRPASIAGYLVRGLAASALGSILLVCGAGAKLWAVSNSSKGNTQA